MTTPFLQCQLTRGHSPVPLDQWSLSDLCHLLESRHWGQWPLTVADNSQTQAGSLLIGQKSHQIKNCLFWSILLCWTRLSIYLLWCTCGSGVPHEVWRRLIHTVTATSDADSGHLGVCMYKSVSIQKDIKNLLNASYIHQSLAQKAIGSEINHTWSSIYSVSPYPLTIKVNLACTNAADTDHHTLMISALLWSMFPTVYSFLSSGRLSITVRMDQSLSCVTWVCVTIEPDTLTG